MEKLKLIITSLSLVFVIICFVASMYITFAVPSETTFILFDIILGAASVWFAFNVYSLIKNNNNEKD